MPNDKPSVLVTGATGQQGGAVARALLERGHRVRITTRRPESAAAEALAQAGAEVFAADFEDRESMQRAATGMDSVFVMATPFELGEAAEVRQGINVVNAAHAAGVKHIIYSSVASANQHTGVPHFDSKFRVEEHVRTAGVPYTIVAPVYFMENLLAPWNASALSSGVYAAALPEGRKLQQVALADIAHFVAEVIARPGEFRNVRIDIASDEQTGAEAAATISRASGRPIQYVEVPIEQVRAGSDDMARMYEWFDKVGYQGDIAGLRGRYPEVGWHTLEEWTAAQDWSQLAAPVLPATA